MAINEIIEIAKKLVEERNMSEMDAIREAEMIVNEKEKEKYEN